jgi:hypothetical protein
MIVKFNSEGERLQWDGVYYFALSDYPSLTDWELKQLILFVEYEKQHNRTTTFDCDEEVILSRINKALDSPDNYLEVPIPEKITACTACKQGGCMTKYVCHTTNAETAKSIFAYWKILSAVNARKADALTLSQEKRNGAGDPPDYFDYVMFNFGNCFGGDSLVIERKNDGIITDYDLDEGFKPSIRFYFDYDKLSKNPRYVPDGNHHMKIKDFVLLSDMTACIIPSALRDEMESVIPGTLRNKVHYMVYENDGVWNWSDKVYSYICERS